MKLAVALVFLLSVGPLLACRCGERPSVTQATEACDLIFVGRVTKMVLEERPAGELNGRQVFREVVVCEFTGLEVFKGPDIEAKHVSVETAPAVPACGFPFEIGNEYLVYAKLGARGFTTDICTRTRARYKAPPGQENVDIAKLKFDDAMITEVPAIQKELRKK